MTSKERILNTIFRKPVDRVPISLYELCQFPGSAYASFANDEPSYAEVLAVMREKTDCIMQTDPTVSYPDLKKRTERREWREGHSVYTETVLHTPRGDLKMLQRRDDQIFTVWTLEHYIKDLEDLEKYMSLDLTCHTDVSKLIHDQQMLGEDGIICPSIADPVCKASELFRMEDFLVLCLTETETAFRFLDFLWESVWQELKQLMAAGLPDMMVRIIGPEYVTPPYLSEEYYADIVTKYLSRMVPVIHEGGGISRVHSHGRVRHALSEFVKTGVLCVDPVEPLPDGDIGLAEVKEKYGSRMTILGNIEMKELELASPERIDQLVRQAMEDAKAGGGFILMPTATPITIPLAPHVARNLITMIEAGHRYGQYESI